MQNRKMISMFLSAVTAISLLVIPANAATTETVTARWNSHVTINYQGQPQNFTDVTGLNMYPISYNDSTYLPIRAVCGLAGLGVDWDNATKTIILTSNGTPVDYTATPARIEDTSVEVKLAKDITVTLDGMEQTFTDANGTVIYPISYMGTNYLPVRAVCGLANISVEWIQETATIELNKLASASAPAFTITTASVDLSTLDLPEGSLAYTNGAISNTVAQVENNETYEIEIPTNGADRVRIVCTDEPHSIAARTLSGDLLCSVNVGTNEFSCTGNDTIILKIILKPTGSYDTNDRTSFAITSIERIYYTSNIEIPEGAYVLDSTNSGLSGDRSAYGDDYIYLGASNRSANSGGYLKFKNPGYTKLTFTVTILEDTQLLRVACMDTFGGERLLTEELAANTEYTVTLDVAGCTALQINTIGNSDSAYVTGAYLHD